MTPGVCGPWPLSFHDNVADAQEKMQMYRVRSKHPAMRWEMGHMRRKGQHRVLRLAGETEKGCL